MSRACRCCCHFDYCGHGCDAYCYHYDYDGDDCYYYGDDQT